MTAVAAGRRYAGVRIRRHKRQPGHAHFMAGVARRAGWNVRGRLSTGVNAVMAGQAGAGLYAVVGESRRIPVTGSVACIARQGGRYMRCRFGLCIDRAVRAAVTDSAISGGNWSGGRRVVHDTRRERGEVAVALVALRGGRNVV